MLEGHGAEPILMPLIRICPPPSWAEFDAAMNSLDQFSWMIFASANSVTSTIARAKHLNLFERFKELRIACVGAATASALAESGLQADLVPNSFVAESLVSEFQKRADQYHEGKHILWPKTTIGRITIKTELEKLGWQVDIVHSYSTEGPEDPQLCAQQLLGLMREKRLQIITLASSETARQLDHILQIARTEFSHENGIPSGVALAVIGPETAKTCKQLFARVDIEAREFSSDGLLAAILEFAR